MNNGPAIALRDRVSQLSQGRYRSYGLELHDGKVLPKPGDGFEGEWPRRRHYLVTAKISQLQVPTAHP